MKPLAWCLLVCLGLSSGRGVDANANEILPPCPSSPNCVVSVGPGSTVPPLVFGADRPWAELRQAVIDLGGQIEDDRDGRLQATYRSRLFGFVDDLICQRVGDLVHIRSASRTGWYDFGVNRRRVEQLRRMVERSDAGG